MNVEKKMSSLYRSRTKARRLSKNSREYKLLSRLASGDCLYCPPNHNENHHGKHSKWGRKKASRRAYTQGKTRSRAWELKGYWDLMDRGQKYWIDLAKGYEDWRKSL